MKKKILVTGATGYIGSKLCTRLLEENYNVIIIKRQFSGFELLSKIKSKIKIYTIDITYDKINKVIKLEKPDVTIHLASLFVKDHSILDIENLINSNITFGTLLIECLVKNNCLNFINTGTSWQHFKNSSVYMPVNLYAATKQSFENIIKYYIGAKKLRCINLKLFDTYGPNDNRPKIFNYLKNYSNNIPLIMTKGEQEIDLIHIDDVINAYIYSINEITSNTKFKYKCYGVGTGKPKTLKKWVSILEKSINRKFKIKWGGKEYSNREVMVTWKKFNKIKPLYISNKNIFDRD